MNLIGNDIQISKESVGYRLTYQGTDVQISRFFETFEALATSLEDDGFIPTPTT